MSHYDANAMHPCKNTKEGTATERRGCHNRVSNAPVPRPDRKWQGRALLERAVVPTGPNCASTHPNKKLAGPRRLSVSGVRLQLALTLKASGPSPAACGSA